MWWWRRGLTPPPLRRPPLALDGSDGDPRRPVTENLPGNPHLVQCGAVGRTEEKFFSVRASYQPKPIACLFSLPHIAARKGPLGVFTLAHIRVGEPNGLAAQQAKSGSSIDIAVGGDTFCTNQQHCKSLLPR